MKIIENLKNKTITGIDGISNQLVTVFGKVSKNNVLVKTITTMIKPNDSYWYIS